MFEKEYIKNLSKLKNRQDIQNNRQTFLQDQNWTSSQKSQPQSRKSCEAKHEVKNGKIFDLQQIKKQLGLIQLKHSVPEKIEKVTEVQKKNISQFSSFKIQKQQIKEDSKKRFSRKTSKVEIKQQQIVDDKGGFTDRINQLVKLRVQHQNIINSLTKKKASNISTQQQSLAMPVKKIQSHSSGYIKVTHQYEVHSPQKQQIQDKKSYKFKNPPPKLEVDTGTFNYKKNKIPISFQEQNKIKQQYIESKTQKKETNKISKKNKKSFTEKQIILKTKSQIQQRSTLTQHQLQSQHQSKQISRIQQNVSQNVEQKQQIIELNQSRFQMQQHVNLLASLSQFQYTNRQNTKKQNEVKTENQLHSSILNFIERNIIKSDKFSGSYSNKKTQIHLIYAGIDQNYQNYNLLIQSMKRSKQGNKNFQKVVQYLIQNQVWQGLFRSQQKKLVNEKSRALIKINEYHGLCFDTGNYIEVLLSDYQLSKNEIKLLMFNLQEQSVIYCDISLILLARLINLQINSSFPEMLHRVFGYQFKTFKIQKLIDFTDCMDFIDRLRDIHNKELRNKGGLIVENNEDGGFKQRYSLSQIQEEQLGGQTENLSILQDVQKHCDFELFGFNKASQNFQLITPYFFSQKNKTVSTIQLYQFRELMKHQKYTKKLSQIYSQLSIINKKQLPVKSIHLKHFSNHFVVVSINVIEEGLHFLSIGQKFEEAQKTSQTEKSIKYRLCLISSNTKTILECLILQKNQSYPVYLPKQEFQVYISAYEFEQKQISIPSENKKSISQNLDQQLLNFTFYIQSHHIIARSVQKMSKKELELELRLKEEYQSYTSMIVEQFIEFSFLEKQITKFFSQIHQINFNKISNEMKDQSQIIDSQNSRAKQQDHAVDNHKQLQKLDLNSQQSYNFPNNETKDDCTSESRILKLSMNNQNAFEIQEWKNYENSPSKSQENQRLFLTFQDLQIQPPIIMINILRVHLKALDLYIDCIDTTQFQKTVMTERQNQIDLTLKYTQQRVLCDINHQNNFATLRLNSINLIYLTKNSAIKSIEIQNEFCQKRLNQNISKSQIKFKIFRKQW